MERTDDFDEYIEELEKKSTKKGFDPIEEEIDEEEERFIRIVNPTQWDVLLEINRIQPILENKIRERGYDWMFDFVLERDLKGVVWMEMHQIVNMWRNSFYYIPEDINRIPQPAKYVNSRRDILKERIRSVPVIKWVKDGLIERLEVMDGRHRLANWRDMGIERVPVRVEA